MELFLLMNTNKEPRSDEVWLNKDNVRKIVFWTVVFWAIIWIMALGLERPFEQPIQNAWVMTGDGMASFPMWGYSLLMRLLGSVTAVVVLQSGLGAFATAALMVRLNCLVPHLKKVTTTLFLLSSPWLSFMAYAYQMPISSAFMILFLLAMEVAITSGRMRWGVAAGVLCGLGQNFRSELLLLPVGVFFGVAVLRWMHQLECRSMKPLALCALVAVALQIPWSLNCLVNEGRFSLSESNLGHVAYLGLGQLPSNPWGIVPKDAFAQETVDQGGLVCDSLSFQGGDFLKCKFVESIKRYPVSYAKSVAWRLWLTLVRRPFSYLSPMGTRSALDQSVKQNAATTNLGVVSSLFSTVFRASPGISLVSRMKAAVKGGYIMGNKALILMVSLFGMVGCFLAIGKAPFTMSQPIVLLLGLALIYRFSMNVLLCAGGQYMTGVYLCYLPFVANTLSALFRRCSQTRA